MTDEARIDAGAAAYRGFLFSDLRGFTAFAERHGNTAAAAMVGRFLELANQQTAQVGGYTGQQVDVTVADGVLAACGGLAGAEAAIFGAGEEVWGASPGERFTIIAVGVGDQAVTILLSTDWTQTPSVQELENLLEHGQRVLDSVGF